MAEAGFLVRHEFSDYAFTPYREGDNLLIVEAQLGSSDSLQGSVASDATQVCLTVRCIDGMMFQPPLLELQQGHLSMPDTRSEDVDRVEFLVRSGSLDEAERVLLAIEPQTSEVFWRLREIASLRAVDALKREDWAAVVGSLERYRQIVWDRWDSCWEAMAQGRCSIPQVDQDLLEEARTRAAQRDDLYTLPRWVDRLQRFNISGDYLESYRKGVAQRRGILFGISDLVWALLHNLAESVGGKELELSQVYQSMGLLVWDEGQDPLPYLLRAYQHLQASLDVERELGAARRTLRSPRPF